jgi:hypothetical protein
MPENESQKDIMARLLAQKKQAGSNIPEHAEFKDKSKSMRGGQFTAKPNKPGGNRGRG